MESILEKLQLIQENPGAYQALTAEEQAELFLYLLAPKRLFRKPKVVNGKDGYTPQPGKDYVSREEALDFLAKLQRLVDEKLATVTDGQDGKDGKDAEITPEIIEDIVLTVTEQIKFPEYTPYDDSALVQSIEDVALDHEQLRDEVEKIKDDITRIITSGVGGGAQVNWVKKYVTDALSGISVVGVAETFETVSKNLSAYPFTISYDVDGNVASIAYNTGTGTITKTLNYTINDDVSHITLSGDTPGGIDLTKTLSYSGGNVSGATYS